VTVIRLATLAFFLCLGACIIAVYGGGPVSRARLERFARRQRLEITEDNGNQVIRYLATTRRWRVAGVTGGFIVSMLTAPAGTIVVVQSFPLFVGWFVGALVAEVRVAHLAYGSVRAASLQPRRPSRYLGSLAWALAPAAALVAVGTGALTAVAALSGVAQPSWSAWLWPVAALAVAGAVRAIQRTVLRRAQPHSAPDVLAADDAIRSRSLHVLSGGGSALVLMVVLGQLGAVHPLAGAAQQAIAGIQILGMFLVAAIGAVVATAAWPPNGLRSRPDSATAVGAL
jgi:hypothetical protein